MTLKFELAKLVFSGASTTILALLGENYKLIILLIIAMIIDTIFGHLRAVKMKEWKSYSARWGLIDKLVELIVIALLYLCEWVFDIDWLVNACVIYFIICEFASIVGNIIQGKLNDNIPAETLEIFTKLKSNFVSRFRKWIRDFFDGGGDNNG